MTIKLETDLNPFVISRRESVRAIHFGDKKKEGNWVTRIAREKRATV